METKYAKTRAGVSALVVHADKVKKAATEVVALAQKQFFPSREEIRRLMVMTLEMRQAHDEAAQSYKEMLELWVSKGRNENWKYIKEWEEHFRIEGLTLENFKKSIDAYDSSLIPTLLKLVPATPEPEVNVECAMPAGTYEVSETNYGESLFSIKRPITTHRTIDIKKS
jgi:hypothetical protein